MYIPDSVRERAGLKTHFIEGVEHLVECSLEHSAWLSATEKQLFLTLSYVDGFQVWNIDVGREGGREVVSVGEDSLSDHRRPGGGHVDAFFHKHGPPTSDDWSESRGENVETSKASPPSSPRSVQSPRDHQGVNPGLAANIDRGTVRAHDGPYSDPGAGGSSCQPGGGSSSSSRAEASRAAAEANAVAIVKLLPLNLQCTLGMEDSSATSGSLHEDIDEEPSSFSRFQESSSSSDAGGERQAGGVPTDRKLRPGVAGRPQSAAGVRGTAAPPQLSSGVTKDAPSPLIAFVRRSDPNKISIFSLRRGKTVFVLRSLKPCLALGATKRCVAVGVHGTVDFYDARNLNVMFSVATHAPTGADMLRVTSSRMTNFALGDRWIAYNLPENTALRDGKAGVTEHTTVGGYVLDNLQEFLEGPLAPTSDNITTNYGVLSIPSWKEDSRRDQEDTIEETTGGKGRFERHTKRDEETSFRNVLTPTKA